MSWAYSVLAILLLALGCGGGTSLHLVPVHGKVTLEDGHAVSGGQVSFFPTSEEKKAGLITGTLGNGGEYKLFTDGKEGAPTGKYKVTVNPSMVPTGGTKGPTTPFNQKYMNPKTTDLTVDVTDNPPPGHYDFKLKK